MDLRVINGAKRNPWIIGWAIGAIAFALIVVWQNRGLTFFWDEWDVVAATLESPYYGILQDNGGNFFPLSRIVFGLELAVFGSWYPGYMLVTSLLFGATTLTFNWLLDDGTKTRRILLTAFSLIYLSSTGVLFASSMGFMLKWALSPLLAILAAAFFIRAHGATKNRNLQLGLAWLFFFLSWAAFSSSIILMALLIVGLIHIAPQKQTGQPITTLQVKISLLILTISMALAVLGLKLAELNPPINPTTGTAQETVDLVSSIDVVSVLVSGLAATFAGLVSVTLSIPLHDNQINSWLVIAFRDYIFFVLVLTALLLGVIYLIRKRLPSTNLAMTFLLLLGANLFLSAARSPLIHRYQTLWIPIAILVILSLIPWFTKLHFGLLNRLLVTVVIMAGVLSGWHIATNALSIATIERQRDLADSTRLTNPVDCLAEANDTLEQVAPTITADRLCEIVETLNARSWILKP